MSQQVYTTVSNVERSPASAAAIASSINANPSPVSPFATLTSPSCDRATSSKSTSPHDRATSTAPTVRLLGRVQVGHPVGAGHRQPAVQRPGWERRHQPLGPPDPTVGRREVGEVRLVGDGQPHRTARPRPPRPPTGGTARRRGRTDRRRPGSHPATTATPPTRSTRPPSRRRRVPARTPNAPQPSAPPPRAAYAPACDSSLLTPTILVFVAKPQRFWPVDRADSRSPQPTPARGEHRRSRRRAIRSPGEVAPPERRSGAHEGLPEARS